MTLIPMLLSDTTAMDCDLTFFKDICMYASDIIISYFSKYIESCKEVTSSKQQELLSVLKEIVDSKSIAEDEFGKQFQTMDDLVYITPRALNASIDKKSLMHLQKILHKAIDNADSIKYYQQPRTQEDLKNILESYDLDSCPDDKRVATKAFISIVKDNSKLFINTTGLVATPYARLVGRPDLKLIARMVDELVAYNEAGIDKINRRIL